MNTLALNNISYGLFVLTASDVQSKLNACILNTAMQVTISPNAIAVAVNKSNLTHEMVASSKEFTISIISEKADFEMFKRFGLQSGRDVDKFCDYPYIAKNSLGAAYITEHTNAYVHGKVKEIVDLGTHSLFIADVLDADILSDDPSMTYDYYHKNVSLHLQFQQPKVMITKKLLLENGYAKYAIMYMKGTSFHRTLSVHGANTLQVTLNVLQNKYLLSKSNLQ